jgi:putative transposase
MDFFVRPLFYFVFIDHGRRKLLHVSATYHPFEAWVKQQLKFALKNARSLRYIITDNDTLFVHGVCLLLKKRKVKHVRTSYRAPWQNPVAEPVIGTLRRDIFNRTLLFSAKQACELLEEYAEYCQNQRSHLTLCRESPNGHEKLMDETSKSKLKSNPVCGGLVHQYRWAA